MKNEKMTNCYEQQCKLKYEAMETITKLQSDLILKNEEVKFLKGNLAETQKQLQEPVEIVKDFEAEMKELIAENERYKKIIDALLLKAV